MTDRLTPEERSWTMSRIRSRHTKPELIIRSLLHRAGFRFRLKNRTLPGSPDLVLPKCKAVIFVHGCFWHRHEHCPRATMPSSNQEYWQRKFAGNIARDQQVRQELERLQWRVLVLWECEIMRDPLGVAAEVVREIEGDAHQCDAMDMERGQILRIAEKKSRNYLDGQKRARV